MRWEGRETWYRLVGGPLEGQGATPVVICHGGPGLTHDYVSTIAELSRRGHPCVLYDQFGSGRSGREPAQPDEFWTVQLFVRELTSLVHHLGITDSYHLIGHSWGGMLAMELAAAGSGHGPSSIVVADAFAASATYSAEVAGLLHALPADVRDMIVHHEVAGTFESPEYQQAVRQFYGRHVCRRRPVPDELLRTLAALDADSTVYRAMMGPSEFTMTGSLRDWDIRPRLGAIRVPTLLLSGRHDEVTPAAVAELHHGIPGSSWTVFEESSHMPHLEEQEYFLQVVGQFLAER